MKILQISIFLLIVGTSCKNTLVKENFDDNGKLISQSEQKEDGTLHGVTKSYIENRLFSEEIYDNGVLHGTRKIFYADGSLEILENYKNGKIDGTYMAYHPNGKEMLKAIYVDGSMQGLVTSYFDDGKVKEEVTFINGEENGPFVEYYPNGNIEWKGTYVPGKEEPNEIGEVLNYNEDGTLIRKLQCDTIYGYNKCKTTWSIDGNITDSVKK